MGLRRCAALVLLILHVAAGGVRGEEGLDWPQWRGPGGLGVADGGDYPLEWGAGTNIAWKTAVPGRGHSSPVVWGDVVSHPIPSAVAGRGLVFVTAGSQAKVALAIRPGASPGDSRVAWRYEKGTAYVPSPILHGRYLYVVTDRGLLTCLDADTGALQYEGGRVPVPATFTASPVAVGGHILLTSEDGDTFVVRAGPVHEVARTNSVGEPVYASPALARGMIFIRGERHLFGIGRGGA